jgi:hypothetical protein
MVVPERTMTLILRTATVLEIFCLIANISGTLGIAKHRCNVKGTTNAASRSAFYFFFVQVQ